MPLSKERYDERKAKGLCVQCNKLTGGILGVVGNGRIRCDSCLNGNKEARRLKRVERRKSGKCTECQNDAMPDCSLCKPCSQERSKSSTKRYYDNKKAGKCRSCGCETENGESRCPKHKQQLKNWRKLQKQLKIQED